MTTTSSDIPVSAAIAVHRLTQHYEDRLYRRRGNNVLANDRECAARMPNQPWEARQVVAHQRHVGRSESRVRAGRAYRDGERRAGDGGSVVHAVTHHRNGTVARDEFLDGGNLLLGQ